MKTQGKIDALKFLMSEKAGVLSTVHDGQPHSAFIYYIADENFSIYFATVVNSRKHDTIQVHNKVSFTVGTIKPPKTVQLEGTAEIVVNEDMIKAVTANYYDVATENNHYPVPITKLDATSGLVIYQIKPNWVQWSDFTEKKEGHSVSEVIINN